ncbi:MAG: ABC transporter ATP-binding protein [Sphaerochaetaceae bacterium]|nr:ABC transporter ATP-binding protein [Sphaerochaetaceae bacterium]
MANANETEINIKGLCVNFPDKDNGGDIQALKDVNLAIKEGSFVSLLGPSGCGKTTLLRSIADLQDISSGIISVKGKTPKETRLSQQYGIVFQSPVLYEWRTVRRNICMPMEVIGLPKEERTRRVDEVLELVGLTEFGRKYPHQLSGGMQQRVGIARALALDPEILLMDEPFSALDEFTKEKLQIDLLSIWQKTKKTILFVTHNIQESVFLSDDVVVLSPHPGRVSAVVNIGLKRPRDLAIRETAEFAALVSKVRHSFEGIYE